MRVPGNLMYHMEEGNKCATDLHSMRDNTNMDKNRAEVFIKDWVNMNTMANF